MLRVYGLKCYKSLRVQILGCRVYKQLEKSYRPDGWTARQVIHHIADSHMNAFIRVKLTLTEDKPVIKPYKQDLWAKLPDNETPVEVH